jgi:2-haloacid dehalogenase
VKPQAVVFDVGNVLIEWNRDRLYGQMIPDDKKRAVFFEQILTMHVNLALDAGAPFRAILMELADMHPAWRDEILAFESRWMETLGPENEQMVGLVHELRTAGVPVFGLTNFAPSTWERTVERHQWLSDLDGVVVSGHERVTKPDRRIYDVLTSRYELDPSATWFTDDSQSNVDGAIAAGWQAELFIDASTTNGLMRELGIL